MGCRDREACGRGAAVPPDTAGAWAAALSPGGVLPFLLPRAGLKLRWLTLG